MAGSWYTIAEVCALVDAEIARLGGEQAAFGPNNGHAQLYSGPHADDVLSKIVDEPARNHKRAFRQAATTNAVLLDNTPLYAYVDLFQGVGVYRYFDSHPDFMNKGGADAADAVFSHVSRKFVASLWGKVATAVCGAGKGRVFYKHEIPTFAETIPELIAKLAKADDIETINNIPIEKIRRLYNPTDYDAAFRLICLGEIRMAWRRARATGLAEDMQDYLERKEFYLVERSVTWEKTAKGNRAIYIKSPEERHEDKQNKLRAFVTAGLAASATTADPTTPVAAPRIAAAGAHLV